jgi:hypothetical protein
MNFETASQLICQHATAQDRNSFAAFVLACQLEGNAFPGRLREIEVELLTALEVINEEARRTSTQPSTELNQAVIEILVTGWDQYRWWLQNQHLSKELLEQFSQLLSDFGFAWARLLDGSTPSLKAALSERKF